MKISADFSQRVVVHSDSLEWIESPMPGVHRKPLDRVGAEVARATTIVRYAPGSKFSPHIHTGGEEFIVLDGIFQDEHGSFPVGAYIRNPPQSKHRPSSDIGCIILVKLWQFQPSDRTHVCLQTNFMGSVQHADFKGIHITSLYKDTIEEVSLVNFEPAAEIILDVKNGAELFVLSGSLDEQNDTLTKHSWLRVPINSEINAKAGKKGAKIWFKKGHLIDVENQMIRVKKA
jgi:hypothetical protein